MMSTAKDYYEILGLQKGASVDEVKKAYRQSALKHHPDRVPTEQKKEAEEKFKEISEAYAVLSDPQKKKLYDQYGHAGIDSRYSTEDIFRSANFSDIFGNSGFGDIFEQFFSDFGFGGTTRTAYRSRQRKGEDMQLEIVISLEEAHTGVEKPVSFWRYDNCTACNGSGIEAGSSKVKCTTCNGQGAVRSGLGFISFAQTCPTCNGEGKITKNPCRSCSGAGRIKVKKDLKVNIPRGVDTGSVLRLKEEGSYGSGGRGDLYIHIGVRTHTLFIREGDYIRCKVNVSIIKAILGGEIEVPTLDGKVKMKVPAGTQPNTIFRLKNKGMMNLRTKRIGDELVEVEVEVPKRLSFRERKIIEEWSKIRNE